jgi:hypothetical protein
MTVARIGQATSFEVVEGFTAFTKARPGRAELLGSWAATVDESRANGAEEPAGRYPVIAAVVALRTTVTKLLQSP